MKNFFEWGKKCATERMDQGQAEKAVLLDKPDVSQWDEFWDGYFSTSFNHKKEVSS